MSNTKTLVNMVANQQRVAVYLTLASDGTQETDYIVYNSATVATLLGIKDPKNCKLISIRVVSSSPLAVVKFNWDASTKVLAWASPYANSGVDMNFDDFGGLQNQGGSGRTGNITMTTTGLAAGDSLALLIEVRPGAVT